MTWPQPLLSLKTCSSLTPVAVCQQYLLDRKQPQCCSVSKHTQSVYYYRRLIIPLQYQILGAGDVVINWFLVLQCMAIATGQPCQDKKKCRCYNSPKNPDFKFDSAPKIPAVLITSWVRDLIIKFIGCISSPESRQSKTVLRCWVLWGNNGGSK